MESILSEDSPSSDFPKRTLILEGSIGNQIVFQRKRGGEEDDSLARKEETEKEPEGDKDHRLDPNEREKDRDVK